MRRSLATVRIAMKALRRNKLRTFLTMLGIIIGVGAVIAMISIGTGARSQLEQQIASLGQNVIMVFSGNFRRGGVSSGMGGAGTLDLSDARAIAEEIPGVAAVSPEVRAAAQLIAGNRNWNAQVMGAGVDYLQIRNWPLSSGSMFGDTEIRSAAKVAILGSTVVRELFGDGDPVGEIIRIRNIPFVVMGVLVSKGTSLMGSDQDDIVVIPYTSAMKRITGNTTLRSILVQSETADIMAPVQQEISVLLRQRHRVPEGVDDDFTIRTQEEISEFATSTSRIMTVLLGAIASVSLLVGGIGIMNIMLVSVTERTREIGIRMSVGAKGRDILFQFLTEATVLSILGGLIGIALGVGTSTFLAQQMNWPTLTPVNAVVLAFLFSAAIGIFFGFYPARKAARLDPIESLRYE
jgi:putative ABC transport system permease protein